MANGYFERGEVYWLRLDGGMGSEMGVGRPCVILSSSEMNNINDCVVVAYTTKQYHPTPYHIVNYSTGIRSYVVCSQLYTYDKTRLQKFAGKLTAEELRNVDDALEKLFDLGYVDDIRLKEKDSEIADRNVMIGDLKAEVAEVKAEIGKRDEEIASLRMEIEMWQKCYGRCMDMLVDTKVNGDLSRRTAAPVEEPKQPTPPAEPPKEPETPKQPEPPKEPEQPEVKDDRLDINNCTATALKKIGFNMAMARKIVESRPFKNLDDLKRVNGLKSTQFKIMEPKLCCNPMIEKEPPKMNFIKDEDPGCDTEDPVVVRKVNINAATAQEIHEVTGVHISVCYSIVGHRKKNGPYTKPEDLLAVREFYPGTLDKCKDKIDFGEPAPEPVVQSTDGKVNINTASAREICRISGIYESAAYSITGYRNKNGPYSSVDDLLNVKCITPNVLAKYRDKMEV